MASERTLELIFSVTTLMATAGWLALIFGYRWSPLKRVLTWGLIPLLLAIAYLVLLLTQHNTQGGLTSLAEMAKLLQNKQVILTFWVHSLAFDLFVGTWETYDAQINKVPHLLVVPALLLTFMFGPVGLGLYFLIRSAYRREAMFSKLA